MNSSDQDLKLAYTEVLSFMNDILDRYDPIVVGAAMLSLTMSLYKTVLPPEEFNTMMEAVAESKDSVRPFTPPKEMMQ
jgi:hypothetical protein